MERTFSNTAAAVFTYVFVNLNLPINHLCHFVWTGSLNGTFLAAFTLFDGINVIDDTNNATAKTYTIKKLKSKKKVYIQVKGYNYDSAGQKVYSSRVLKKTVKVK